MTTFVAFLAFATHSAQSWDGGATVTIFQEDIQTDIDVEFMGQAFNLYLNVSLNGQWVATYPWFELGIPTHRRRLPGEFVTA